MREKMSEIEIVVSILGEEEKEEYSFPPGNRILDLLEELDRNPEAIVVERNGIIVPEDEELEDKDELRVIPVVSGG